MSNTTEAIKAWDILQGDALSVLKSLPDNSVHCTVTSPPYFGLRDYGMSGIVWPAVSYAPMPGLPNLEILGDANCDHEWGNHVVMDKRGVATKRSTLEGPQRPDARGKSNGQYCQKCAAWCGCLGLEPTIEMFIGHLVLIFREIKRVLRSDGTVWLNMGDTYSQTTKWGGSSGGKNYTSDAGGYPRQRKQLAVADKNILMVPARLALALQADGWSVRQDGIWHKTAAMPENVSDRPSKAHEYVFLLSKSKRYFYDSEAVRVEASPESIKRISQKNFANQTGGDKDYSNGVNRHRSVRQALENFAANPGRNLRSVWSLNPEPDDSQFCSACHTLYSGKDYKRLKGHVVKEGKQETIVRECRCGRKDAWLAHFAAFPTELPKLCIMAGTSEKGCCAKCGAPYTRLIEKNLIPTSKAPRRNIIDDREASADGMSQSSNRQRDGHHPGMVSANRTIGWQASCKCEAGEPVPCTVLDPFAGRGTTMLVASMLTRRSIGIEMNPNYIALAHQYISRRIGVAPEETQTVAGTHQLRLIS